MMASKRETAQQAAERKFANRMIVIIVALALFTEPLVNILLG